MLILMVVLIGVSVYLYRGNQTPSGQPPLERLTAQNAASIKNAFNAAKNDIRVLLFFSPT